MSDSEQPYSMTRPYECERCGGAMRTRGIDGVCIHCVALETCHRCEVCHRVRFGVTSDWEDHPGRLPREHPARCATCAAKAHEQAEAAYWRGLREASRRKATGTCEVREPDPFKGMREGDA